MNESDSEPKQKGLLDEGAGSPEKASPDPGLVRCPKCASANVRRRSRPLLFNIGAIVLLGPFLMLTFVFDSCAFGLFWLWAQILLFFALPVTAAIALVGRHHCRDCRHRFVSARETDVEGITSRFPWLLLVLDIVLLVVFGLVAPGVIRARADAGRLADITNHLMTVTGATFVFGVALWASVVYQVSMHYLLRRKAWSGPLRAVVFVLPALAVGGLSIYVSLPIVRARQILSRAELAPLPESVRGLKIHTWWFPDEGGTCLRFTTDPVAIERFIGESPVLKDVECKRFSAEKMRLKYPKDYGARHYEEAHEYVMPDPSLPDWYKWEIKGDARRYTVRSKEQRRTVIVLVDDEEHVVYVQLFCS